MKRLFTALAASIWSLFLIGISPVATSADSPGRMTEHLKPHVFDMDPAPGETATHPLVRSSRAPLFHDVPALTGQYSVQDMTLMPYIGAGFGGGFISDLDRALGLNSSLENNPGFRNPLSQTMTPNELQLGIRVPF
jgi:hypothetical protein